MIRIRRCMGLAAFALILATLGLSHAADPRATSPVASAAAPQVGDTWIRNERGEWILQRRGGQAVARPTSQSPSRPASQAELTSALSAESFARHQGLRCVNHGSYCVLEDGVVRCHVYADSSRALVMTKSLALKAPVRRQGSELILPAAVCRCLQREIGRCRTEAAHARSRRSAERERVVARARALQRALYRPRPVAPTPVRAAPPAATTRVKPSTRTPAPSAPQSSRPRAGWVPPSNAPKRTWKWIVLHHSDDLSGDADKYHRVHLNERGWEHGLGYHFVVGNGSLSGDGEVEIGPRWRKQLHGAHAKTPDNRFNDHGVGICLVGDFDEGTARPTGAQMDALVRLCRWLMTTYGISASNVLGHCDCGCATACPGKNFPWAELRRRLGQ